MLPAASSRQIFVLASSLSLTLTLSLSGVVCPQPGHSQSLHKDKKTTQLGEVLTPIVPMPQAQAVENINPGIWLDPRFGVQLTTGPGSGYESSFGTFSGWIPFAQDGFSNLFYTEAQGRIDTHNGRWGGNWSVGYRNFASAVILGTYVSYDVQDVGSFTAHQLGLGLEALHPSWEARLNGYLPVGDRSINVSETSTTLSQSLTNPRFSGTQLLVTPQSTVQRDVTSDNALAGLDLEGGVTLTRWTGGQLQGFVGSYLYGGSNTDTFVGFRSRLLAQMENFNAGLSLESDRVFGTNVLFSVGASWGGGSRSAAEEVIMALLSKPAQRQKNIAIARYTESTVTTVTEAETAALNPDTGAAWNIIHVNVNNGSSSGTGDEGSPLDTIAAGVAQATSASGNDVVYVEGDNTVSQAGFTIPAKTKVLSSGPTQTLAVSNGSLSGTATLPRSGTGVHIPVTSTVTFSDGGGELDGFAISTTSGRGVVLSDVAGTVVIENNQISNTAEQGIELTNMTGTLDLTIRDNTFANTNDDAIKGSISNSNSLVTATIEGNQINTTVTATSDGIDFEVRDGGQLTAAITGNTISNAGNSGIELEAYAGATVLNSTITGNTISNSGGDGILFLNESDRNLTMTISNNLIENSGVAANGLTQTTALFNTPISIDIGAGGFGVAIITLGDGSTLGDGILALTAESNTINNSQDAKFGIAVNPSFLFTNRTVSPLGSEVVVQSRVDGRSQVNATLRLNTFSGTGIGIKDLSDDGLLDYNTGSFGALVGDSGTICLNLENNTAADVGSATTSGYQFVQNGGSSTLTLDTNSGNSGSFVTTEGTVGSGTC